MRLKGDVENAKVNPYGAIELYKDDGLSFSLMHIFLLLLYFIKKLWTCVIFKYFMILLALGPSPENWKP